MLRMEAGSSKGKGKAVEEPEKWDMVKGYENLNDNESDDEENWVRKERLRLARVAGCVTHKSIKDPLSLGYEPHTELHGSWVGYNINMVEDWMCLYDAAMAGNRHAIRYAAYLNSLYQCPSLPRLPGIQCLLS
jgi:hypothetical protein